MTMHNDAAVDRQRRIYTCALLTEAGYVDKGKRAESTISAAVHSTGGRRALRDLAHRSIVLGHDLIVTHWARGSRAPYKVSLYLRQGTGVVRVETEPYLSWHDEPIVFAALHRSEHYVINPRGRLVRRAGRPEGRRLLDGCRDALAKVLMRMRTDEGDDQFAEWTPPHRKPRIEPDLVMIV